VDADVVAAVLKDINAEVLDDTWVRKNMRGQLRRQQLTFAPLCMRKIEPTSLVMKMLEQSGVFHSP
jgi:hypothetical protein